jgi:tellurite methyltransferase
MPDWNSLFTEKENRWEKTYEDVVSLFGSKSQNSNSKVLDLGCGAGRHLQYLEKLQLKTIGMDISRVGLDFSQKRLIEENLPARLVQADMAIPFPFRDNCFDYVISIHVIFHNIRQKVQFTLAEIKRTMKPDAVALLTFNSTLSSRFGSGVEIEKDTWIPELGIDKGIPHHFSTLEDVVDLMSEFKVLNIRFEEKPKDESTSCHWVVTAQK